MLLETLDPAGAHCADFPLPSPSPSLPAYPARASLKGAACGVSRAGRKRILKQGGNCLSFSRAEIFLPRASSFLRECGAGKRGKEDPASSDASPDALGLVCVVD